MTRPRALIMFSEGNCFTCGEETPREESGSAQTTSWARKHGQRHPTHKIYVEQGRLLVYEPTASELND